MARTRGQPKGPVARVADSFQNFAARIGWGTNNLQSNAYYGRSPLSRRRDQMENAYRSSWLVGVGVDAIADDMVRAGVTFLSQDPPENVDQIYRAMNSLGIWTALGDTIRWARLYGGALGVMLIDGQRLDTPLRLDTIKQGQFKGMVVLDRWMVSPNLGTLITDYGPDFGMPANYTANMGSGPLNGQMIHHSRVIRMDGVTLPYYQRQAENLWGQSIIERLWDRLIAFDSTTNGAAQLVHKAHLRTMSIDKLRDLLGTTQGEGLLARQMEQIRMGQTNEGLTLIDSRDTFEAHQYSFGGLAELLSQFGEQIAGALQTPLVRLLGQSPAGFSTGDSDLANYYDSIHSQQESKVRRPMTPMIEVLHRSVLGRPPPDGFGWTFNPLKDKSDKDRAEIGEIVTRTVAQAEGAGIVSRATALMELRASSRTTGLWTNITDDEIAEADEDPPPAEEALLADEMEPEEEDAPGGAGGKSADGIAPVF